VFIIDLRLLHATVWGVVSKKWKRVVREESGKRGVQAKEIALIMQCPQKNIIIRIYVQLSQTFM